jgi:hypothetical protein
MLDDAINSMNNVNLGDINLEKDNLIIEVSKINNTEIFYNQLFNDQNFGHRKIIYKGLKLPMRIFYNNYDNNFMDVNKESEMKYLCGMYKNKEIKYDENIEKKLLQIYKINISCELFNNNFDEYNDVVLSLSLFSPNYNLSENLKKIFNDVNDDWSNRYFKPTIKQLLIVRYYFPEIEIREYFDHYLMNKIEKYTNNIIYNADINVDEYIDYEFEIQKNEIQKNEIYKKIEQIQIKIKQFNDFINEIVKTMSFQNQKYIFLFIFEIACRFKSYADGIFDISGKGPNIFVYKFFNTFIEYKGQTYESVLTNSYLGSLVRYFPLRQFKYCSTKTQEKNTCIERPKFIFLRDAHANCMGYNDYMLIKEFNEHSKNININKSIYLLPTTPNYVPDWNDKIKCTFNTIHKYYTRSAVAGWVQMANYSTDNDDKESCWLSDFDYISTIGLAFMLNKLNKPELLHHRAYLIDEGYMKPRDRYGYGIDEYILSKFYNNINIKKQSIYLNHDYLFVFEPYFTIKSYDYNNTQPYLASWCFMFMYVLKYDMAHEKFLKNEFTMHRFFKVMEDIRNLDINTIINMNKQNKEEIECLRLILNILPSKYETIFTAQCRPFDNEGYKTYYDILYFISKNYEIKNKNEYKIRQMIDVKTYNKDNTSLTEEIKKYLYWKFNNDKDINNKDARDHFFKEFDTLTYENLKNKGITIYSSLFRATLNPCMQTYYEIDKYYASNKSINNNKYQYRPELYYSGFYNEIKPATEIGILRRPQDLPLSIHAINNNNYVNKLEISNYQIMNYEYIWKAIIKKNPDINYITNIKNQIKNNIKNEYGLLNNNYKNDDIYFVSTIFNIVNFNVTNEDDIDNVIEYIIYKTLNLNGYYVPINKITLNLKKDLDYNAGINLNNKIFEANYCNSKKINNSIENEKCKNIVKSLFYNIVENPIYTLKLLNNDTEIKVETNNFFEYCYINKDVCKQKVEEYKKIFQKYLIFYAFFSFHNNKNKLKFYVIHEEYIFHIINESFIIALNELNFENNNNMINYDIKQFFSTLYFACMDYNISTLDDLLQYNIDKTSDCFYIIHKDEKKTGFCLENIFNNYDDKNLFNYFWNAFWKKIKYHNLKMLKYPKLKCKNDITNDMNMSSCDCNFMIKHSLI